MTHRLSLHVGSFLFILGRPGNVVMMVKDSFRAAHRVGVVHSQSSPIVHSYSRAGD